MYKKILYTILSVVTMLSIAACGGSDSGKEPTKAPKATETSKDDNKNKNEDKDLSSLFGGLEDLLNGETAVEVTPVVFPNETPTDSDEDLDWDDEDDDLDWDDEDDDLDWDDEDDDFDWDDEDDATSSSAIAVADGVIVDNAQCTYKILSVDEDGLWGYTLYVELVNKTDTELCFSMDDTYVNGVYCDPYWYEDVEAGETVTSEVSFYSDDFDALDITEVTSILFMLTVYDNDNWDVDNFVEDFFVFYPEGEENAVVYQYDFDSDDTILVENDDFLMAITDYEYDETWGYMVDVYMENKTSDYLMYSLDDVSVNGFLCDPYWAFSVPSGMKAHSTFRFDADDLEACEITEVTSIEFLLDIYENDNWENSYCYDSFTLYPLGEEAALENTRTPKDTDIVLFDNDVCTMIITAFEEDDIWGYTVNAYIENKSDKELYINLNNAKVNGIDCDPFWIEVLAPGKKCYTQIDWSTYQFEENNITTVESIELPITVTDYEDWSVGPYVDDTFTITP